MVEEETSAAQDSRKQYEITNNRDDRISLDQWSEWNEIREKENSSSSEYEVKLEDKSIIPMEEWSKCDEIYKEENPSIPETSGVQEKKCDVDKVTDAVISETIPCPSCGGKIKKDVLKCKYCGEIIRPTSRKKVFL